MVATPANGARWRLVAASGKAGVALHTLRVNDALEAKQRHPLPGEQPGPTLAQVSRHHGEGHLQGGRCVHSS